MCLSDEFMNIDIRNIDCMDLMKEFEDNQFDLAICDPPYFDSPSKLGFYAERCSRVGVNNGYSKLGDWEVPDQEYFDELQRVSKHQIIWGINYYQIQNLGTGRIFWNKHNKTSSFSDGEIAYCSLIDSVRIIDYMWSGMLQGSLSDGSRMEGNKKLNEKRIHPNQKPVQLYKILLEKFAKSGDSILETHLGSGSIAIAAHYANVHLTASEKDKDYFRLANERIKRETSQTTFFDALGGGYE